MQPTPTPSDGEITPDTRFTHLSRAPWASKGVSIVSPSNPGPLGNISFEDMALITLDAISDAVMVVDPDGKLIYLNKVAEKMTGWPRAEALGRYVEQVFFIFDGATRERAPNPAQRAIEENQIVELALGRILVRRDGKVVAIEDSAAPIIDRNGRATGAVIVFHDARQSGAAIQEMSYRAQHDFLTGLPNRMCLMERLTHAIGMANRHNKKIAVLFLDMDDFKMINDTHGHAVGDHLLQEVSTELQSCVRTTDTVSRHGGDEFVILLTEIEERQDAAQIAEKVLARFASPRTIDGIELQVALSIGIAVYPENGTDADTMMRNADVAMYATKANGRNSYQFFQWGQDESIDG
ncbi:diguanylate cyclase domain-containing protein [Marinobacter confluentis]|uniref:Diguanylate cyclase n=1 Tax=Marinobacter confluentis TaxID=1697557 RepID=A0A4Z1BKH1_9GAMM|nr:diguanylate cyclase [Marinobacter confluentis]TGN40217.1 diguanylate cyclase [Marinobacter confluentis]